MIALIRTIFFLVIFYYLFKLIARLFLPYVLKRGMERMQQQQQNMNNYQERAKAEEGKVTITQKHKNTSNSNLNTKGEYVDFEEVK